MALKKALRAEFVNLPFVVILRLMRSVQAAERDI